MIVVKNYSFYSCVTARVVKHLVAEATAFFICVRGWTGVINQKKLTIFINYKAIVTGSCFIS
mgnify:CR=1 FL=1